tara:strand:+ start:691 stop:804 length:114 start_codon:yes stop_codon:yes gene_type:complete
MFFVNVGFRDNPEILARDFRVRITHVSCCWFFVNSNG